MGFVSELGFVSKLWATDRKGDSADRISAFSYIFFKDAIVPRHPQPFPLVVVVVVINILLPPTSRHPPSSSSRRPHRHRHRHRHRRRRRRRRRLRRRRRRRHGTVIVSSLL